MIESKWFQCFTTSCTAVFLLGFVGLIFEPDQTPAEQTPIGQPAAYQDLPIANDDTRKSAPPAPVAPWGPPDLLDLLEDLPTAPVEERSVNYEVVGIEPDGSRRVHLLITDSVYETRTRIVPQTDGSVAEEPYEVAVPMTRSEQIVVPLGESIEEFITATYGLSAE